jgi:hypothetical protein
MHWNLLQLIFLKGEAYARVVASKDGLAKARGISNSFLVNPIYSKKDNRIV